MKKVEEIKVKRQNQHIANRLRKGKELRKASDINEVKKNIHLIRSPAALASKLEKRMVQVVKEEDEAMEEA